LVDVSEYSFYNFKKEFGKELPEQGEKKEGRNHCSGTGGAETGIDPVFNGLTQTGAMGRLVDAIR
jgi:hypothetical protein